MAKATKVPAVNPLANDTAIVARDFATFGQFTVNNDAKAALLRRMGDKDQFNALRIAACAAHIVHNSKLRGEAIADATARAMCDGSMRNVNSTIGNKPKRDETQEGYVKRALAAWAYYLKVNGIDTQNKDKANRKPRTPKSDAPTSEESQADILARFVKKAPDDTSLAAQFLRGVAYGDRVVSANAANLKGNKGSALRAAQKAYAAAVKAALAIAD